MTTPGAHGVYDDGQPAGTPALVRPGGAPTCPWCGKDGLATPVHHHTLGGGGWYCACGSLYVGTDAEWRRLAKHRREAVDRNARYSSGDR